MNIYRIIAQKYITAINALPACDRRDHLNQRLSKFMEMAEKYQMSDVIRARMNAQTRLYEENR